MGSQQSIVNTNTMEGKIATSGAPTSVTAAADAVSKPKPCCVCKDEKAKRDECMLFSKADDPAADCKGLVEQYKSCMAGFGYNV
ncbi:COX17 protein [Emericellopsis atlantica]|uniref:COX17 protein n=1 Tax=Emericellopsis atlantica TaxID=2614577 RepID=A0A9P8CT35_9HYPO|nr:COX17 protein [Emericellopsis atlantica]KAG9257997.1 COX17 protein [Emericellopsis atlantica]